MLLVLMLSQVLIFNHHSFKFLTSPFNTPGSANTSTLVVDLGADSAAGAAAAVTVVSWLFTHVSSFSRLKAYPLITLS